MALANDTGNGTPRCCGRCRRSAAPIHPTTLCAALTLSLPPLPPACSPLPLRWSPAAQVRETATAVTEFLQAVSDRGDPLPTRCVLVGGFANSVSLTAAVSASAAAFAVPTIKPTDTWTTVVKGAVLFGLQPRIDIIEER